MKHLISEVSVRSSNNNGLVEPHQQQQLVSFITDGFSSYCGNLPKGHSHSFADNK